MQGVQIAHGQAAFHSLGNVGQAAGDLEGYAGDERDYESILTGALNEIAHAATRVWCFWKSA